MNRYTNQSKSNNEISHEFEWTDTNSNEIITFLRLLILQGLCSKPETKMHFSKLECISTSHAPVSALC